MAQEKPYGSWPSPITSEYLVKDKIGLGTIHVEQNRIFWTEMRPKEKGRYALVEWKDGEVKDLLPKSFNVRTRVHEYGGNCFAVAGDTIYFSNFQDGQLYQCSPGKPPIAITKNASLHFADPKWNAKTGHLFVVCEDMDAQGEPENYIASIKPGMAPQKIAAGHNFYASIAISPSGKKIAWICWNHPNMPWDGTELWIAKIDDQGHIQDAQFIAGGIEESISEPKWVDEDELYFISDKSGFWNLYSYQKEQIKAIYPKAADFGVPLWVFGTSRFEFLPGKKIACIYTEKAIDYLGIIDLKSGFFQKIDVPFTQISELNVQNGHIIFKAGSEKMLPCIVRFDLKTQTYEILKNSGQLSLDPTYFSEPVLIEFPTEKGKTAFGFYYPPKHPTCRGMKDELPPLLVLSHGGPTSHASPVFDLKKQYWTSRGFAIVDVNYGGSTGFGRSYRERLNKNWGIVDVDDCVNAALYLVKKKWADPERIAIAGGSAGGYTTLAALTFRNVFKAGASYFGVSDLEALATDTHKFESRYLDRLIGPYPEKKELYIKRSPIHHVEKLSCPIILLQGNEDKIVPPSQSEKMFESLKKKGIPTAYILFENEQHGFRSADAIKRSIEAEYYFYSQIFGFSPTEDVQPIPIINLKS